MYRIFIVEDDAAIAQAVCEQAESWALEARCVSDFRRVAEEAAAYGPHLILLDISLPFFDGYHWCRHQPRAHHLPVLGGGQYEHRHGHEHGRRRFHRQAL